MISASLQRASFFTLLFAVAALAVIANVPALAQAIPIYKNPKASLGARVNDLFNRLTYREKIGLLTGTSFSTNPISRLGIPAMQFADAGQGVRGGGPGTTGPATLFPAGVAMASTWDPELVGQIGKAIGQEALNKGPGVNIMLGPAVNIHRSPLCGRDGEYFSEDPYLASRLAVGYIEGMQSTGCGSCIKHYCCNNEEVDRGEVNVRVDERALREIYLPAFEASAREAHVRAVMAAYNRVNGPHATANRYLLTDVLKKCWDWDGMVMSDWGAVHETARVINAGNDLEMPGPGYLRADHVNAALHAGLVTQSMIDANVHRILRAIIRCGLADGKRHIPDHSVVNSIEHEKLAFEAASKGIILLKNEHNLLPLDASKLRSLAVIGPAAVNMQFGASGSVSVDPIHHIDPLDGITERIGHSVTVDYAEGIVGGTTIPQSAFTTPDGSPGLKAQYFNNEDMFGEPVVTNISKNIDFNWLGEPVSGVPNEHFSVRWTGKITAPATGPYTFIMTADDGCRVFIDGHEILAHWVNSAAMPISGHANLIAGHSYDLRIEYFQGIGLASANFSWAVPGAQKFDDAIAAASKSDVAIVLVSTLNTEGEGQDRPTMDLPDSQDQLINAVSAVNKNTIVVLNNGSPVTLLPWLNGVPALIESWFPGEEGGRALAAVLFGDVNPSGKLPDTLAVRREDYPDFGNFPGTRGVVHYAESIYVGYRHFDKQGIEPVFPFGYELSYTSFSFNNLRLSSPTLAPNGDVSARVDITNTGSREGAEVAELYVRDTSPKIDKPIRELKGFGKVDLLPGQTKTLAFTLNGRSLAYCDVFGKQWKADRGTYQIELGASSRDIRASAPLDLISDYTEPIPYMADASALVEPVDLARNHPATASSVERSDTPAKDAFDGDDSTRWSSAFFDPQWLSVDLGGPALVDGVRLLWEAAYGAAYKIQVSLDGTKWTDACSTTNGQGGEEIFHFKPVRARYVRMYGLKRGTIYGYSLYSFEVYGPGPAKPGR